MVTCIRMYTCTCTDRSHVNAHADMDKPQRACAYMLGTEFKTTYGRPCKIMLGGKRGIGQSMDGTAQIVDP